MTQQPYQRPPQYAPPPQQQQYAQPQPQYAQPQYAPPPPQQQQQYAPPQPQYAPPQPYPGPQPQAAPMVQCRLCGCVPAANVKFRGHQGMILLMRFLSLDGPFCRDCGLATFRRMTARTLVQGWWGYASFVITPIVVLINLVRRDKVANLPAPQAAPGGGSRQPMDPGPPLLARPMALIGLAIPAALLLLFVVALIASANT
jgi:hypothetical protein